MLIGFKVRNFRSFLGEQVFSFAPSSDRTHEATHCMRTGMKSVPRVSKTAAVFGPNASGKTNLLQALATLRDLILHFTSYSDAELRDRHTPFQFGPSIHQPTDFEIDVLLDRVRYRYSLSYDSRRVLAERLLVYRTGKAQRWFERRFDAALQRDEWAPFSPHFKGPREMWRKATRPRALFLTAAAQLNSDQLAPLLRWIEHRLEILFREDLNNSSRIAALIQNDGVKARILALLQAVDLPVADVRMAERPLAQSDAEVARAGVMRPLIEFLYIRQDWTPVWMASLFEASGTQRLFALFGPLLTALDQGKLLLVDEFDTGQHSLIARYLIQLVNDPRASKHGAQLLLTSHNHTLMDAQILRRDQIWLMQLDEQQASNLSPLCESSPRKGEGLAKSYLSGRYGAVPRIRPELSGLPQP